MGSYSYISIPTSRLTDDWLIDNGFSNTYEINTFVCYHTTSELFDHYLSVEDEIHEFICNTQKEFEQKIRESKLLKLLNQ